MPRLKLTLAYEGTGFAGWQIQAHRNGPQPRTVQGALEQALARLVGGTVRVHGAGRTDAGVHAVGQVAHVDAPRGRTELDWQRALNALLPDDVAVLDVEEVPDSFHARKSAKAKTYAYSLWLSRKFVLPMRRRWVWPTGPLDVEAMDRAARHMAGRHDFASFQNVGTDMPSTVRTIHSIRREPGGDIGPSHLEMAWVFTADGFLKQMVRNLVGCLVEVGRGKLDPDAVPGLLESRDRTLAPATAPPQGLTMVDVAY